jgi:hypothetical protein
MRCREQRTVIEGENISCENKRHNGKEFQNDLDRASLLVRSDSVPANDLSVLVVVQARRPMDFGLFSFGGVVLTESTRVGEERLLEEDEPVDAEESGRGEEDERKG